MSARRALLVGATLAAFAACLRASELKRWKGNAVAPPIDLLTVTGTPFRLEHLRGKVVLVNFWVTWCEPCVTEMPSLQRVRDELSASGFEVLAVNYQEGPARINAFLQQMNLTLPVVRDTDGGVARNWGARVFPASYLVDRGGNVRHAIVGPADWTSAPLISTIRSLLVAQPSR